jgi:hypothetical protein
VFVVCRFCYCLVYFECWNSWLLFCFEMGCVLNGLIKYLMSAFYVHVCVMSHYVLEGEPLTWVKNVLP